MVFPKVNLHCHSNFSDGSNTIKQITKKALKLELEYLAITDHFTNSWKADIIPSLDSREKVKAYLDAITECIEVSSRISKNLKIFKGIEIDLGSSEDYIEALIQPEKYDIILFEYLETLEGLTFVKILISEWRDAVKDVKDFPILGLAHFDPEYFNHSNMDLLIAFLKENDIYFEFNSRYPSFYSPDKELFFQELKEKRIRVAIGSDCHSTKRLGDLDGPLEMVKYYNLEDNFNSLLRDLDNKKISTHRMF